MGCGVVYGFGAAMTGMDSWDGAVVVKTGGWGGR